MKYSAAIFPTPQAKPASQHKLLLIEQEKHVQRLEEKWGSAFVDKLKESELWLLGVSDFIADTLFRYGEDSLEHIRSSKGFSCSELESTVLAVESEHEVCRAIRKLRHLEMARIASQDLLGKWSVVEVMEANTFIADALILASVSWSERSLEQRYGRAIYEGEPVPLWVIGMGKLGGRELNFSSDIDLIFCFEYGGETSGGKRSIDHELYFTKLTQLVVKLLNQTTVDGQAFRVDLRLRPFGQSGPIVTSLSALEAYYQEQGRNWERYAMIKSRVINCDQGIEKQFSEVLRPFVYRRYIDYSAIDALRKMKKLINQEARRQQDSINVKLGIGGIREVEFIAQVYQLMRGGREPELQTRSLLEALSACTVVEVLEDEEVELLALRYFQLRKIEHVLQEINDEQTQRLPDDELQRHRVIESLGYSSWDAFLGKYTEITNDVHAFFSDLFGGEEDSQLSHVSEFNLLWHDLIEDETAISVLADAGAENPEACWERIHNFRHHLKRRSSGPRGRELLADLIPELIGELVNIENTNDVLQRVFDVLERVASRTTYLELLYSNAGARNQLVSLCAKSAWVAHLIAKFPILLDELIDPLMLFDLPEPSSYGVRVAEYLNRFALDDAEMQMEALRQVKQIFQLHVAAADLSNGVEVMKVSDHLTHLAQALVGQVVMTAWRQLAEKHGVPPGKDEANTGFGVVAYGKLGGFELGYGSDLDLVFLCEDEVEGETDGVRPIDSQQFYLRLAQRTLHLFTTRTGHGVLYDVDMRLRPSGQSGLMVIRASTYKDYLMSEAWTWEIQALVRARFIFGHESLQQQFKSIREFVLSQPRDIAELKNDIAKMREKLRSHALTTEKGRTDIKQAKGGMTDIEFITQYIVLAFSEKYPELMIYTDNVRILEYAREQSILSDSEFGNLVDAYKELRAENHKLSLAEKRGLSERAFAKPREQVSRIWQRLIQSSSF